MTKAKTALFIPSNGPKGIAEREQNRRLRSKEPSHFTPPPQTFCWLVASDTKALASFRAVKPVVKTTTQAAKIMGGRPGVKRTSEKDARRSWWGKNNAGVPAATATQQDQAAEALEQAAMEEQDKRPGVRRESKGKARRSWWGKKEVLQALEHLGEEDDESQKEPAARGRGGIQRSDETNARRSWWGGSKKGGNAVPNVDETKELEQAIRTAEEEDAQ